MKRAYPVNIKGEQIGPVRSISDRQWEKISKMKDCRWKLDDGKSQVAAVTDIISEPKVSTLKAKSKTKPKQKQSEE